MPKQAKLYSFESLINRFFTVSLLCLFACLATITYLAYLSVLAVITLFLLFVVPFALYARHVKNAIKTPLQSLSASLEAVRNEDYSLKTHPKFNSGAIKQLSDEVNLMADDLRLRKLHYDQQAVLVLNLIEQLGTPIAVFDHASRLSHANEAFSSWCGKPWQQAKLCSAANLGLIFEADNPISKWQVADKDMAGQWQLRHSHFSMLGEQHQLVVLTNVEKVVSETERLAWHKMTRVLSHEINNSLSPIKSLAHSLVDLFSQQNTDQASLEALEVIASRSDNLMQFVNRYACLNQRFDVVNHEFELLQVLTKVKTLFSHPINIQECNIKLTADPVLLEQVLINLIKNAVEASPEHQEVTIRAITNKHYSDIIIEDNGSGIANPENLFVPFYTTKKDGKGIGLALSRNMIEQQGGSLKLRNKEQGSGVQVLLRISTSENR